MTSIQFDEDGQLKLGASAPNFNLPNVVDGVTVALDDRIVSAPAFVVIFSCNHCPWVIKWEDKMISLGQEYQAKGVRFFVISSNDIVKYPQDGPGPMKIRAGQKGYPFPYLFDESQEVARAYGAQVTPHIFLFDSNRKLVYRGAIDDNPERESRPTAEWLRDAIDSTLDGQETTMSTRAVGCSVKWR